MVDHARAVVSANAAKRARAVSATAAPAAPDASSTALTVAEDRIDVAELLMWAGEDGSDPGADGDAAALTAGGGGAAGGAAAGLSAGVPARTEDESPDTLRMRRLQMSDHVTRGGATLLEVVPPSGAKGKDVAPIAVLAPSPGKPTGFVGLEELTASSSATPKASGTPGMSGGTRAALLGSYSGRLKPEDVEAAALSPPRGRYGATPLHSAALGGRPEIAEALLRGHVALLDAPAAGLGGATPLMLAACAGRRGAKVGATLLRAGANASTALAGGAHAVAHVAAYFGSAELLSAIVTADAELAHATCARGLTPIHYAALGANPRCVEILLGLGPKIAEKIAEATPRLPPLHCAAISGCAASAKALLGAAPESAALRAPGG